MKSIPEMLEEKQIKWLYHFTKTVNLSGIFEHGLLPVDTLERKDIFFAPNDSWRHDLCRDAVCLSIEFPNYKTFYKHQMEHKDESWVDWAVLQLDASILVDDFDVDLGFCWKCAFYETNAANGKFREANADPVERMSVHHGVEAFEKLFAEINDKPTRNELGIPDCYPTDPQAEVLFFGEIPIKYITKVIFAKEEVLKQSSSLGIPKEIEICVDGSLFAPRRDWGHWTKES